MDLTFFKNKKITVFGLGLHGGGVAVVKFLVKNGAKVIVTDIKTRAQLLPSLEKLKGLKNIEYVLGQHRVEDFTNVDMVIKNPGASWENKHIKMALEKGIPVEIDSSLFFKLCKQPIIGVTGTKGKTTTTTIIYEILAAAGKNPVKVGIGQVSVLDKLEVLKKDSIVVFELSSWRLSALGRAKASPHVAVFTNIFVDHLNYYKTMEHYVADKKFIFSHQKPKDWLIINADDEALQGIIGEAKSQVIKFSYQPLKNGQAIFINERAIYFNDGVDGKKVIDVDELKIRGEHNLGNVMAAIGAVKAFGVGILEIKKALLNVTGVPHRLEFVRELKGVKYYNDTAATIPDAAIAALNTFSEPIILIAGGADKNLDFSRFGKEIMEKAKGIVLLKGEATDKLIKEIKKNMTEEKELVVVDSMEKAVEIASREAIAGDVVLLSPGAASFRLFLNEFDRGDKFKEAVMKLK
jgi:UDP-N-acetylmuramoylalanine--D-glutamate ligase